MMSPNVDYTAPRATLTCAGSSITNYHISSTLMCQCVFLYLRSELGGSLDVLSVKLQAIQDIEELTGLVRTVMYTTHMTCEFTVRHHQYQSFTNLHAHTALD